MNRTGLVLVTASLGAACVIGACSTTGELSNATMPPMYTTTTSTSSLTTSTIVTNAVYKVKKGDKLANIASVLHVSMDELMALNNITNPSKIFAGQVLKIPPNTIVEVTIP